MRRKSGGAQRRSSPFESLKLDKALFALVLALCALVVVLMFVPDQPDYHGIPHPDFPSMLQGGPGTERHARVLGLGWLFGTLQLVFFACLIAFGARKNQSLRGLGKPLLVGLAAHTTVWTLCVLSYRTYLTEPTHAFVLGFPISTAIMVYGMWLTPVIYNFLFVFGFKRWYLTDQDLADFDRLMESKRS